MKHGTIHAGNSFTMNRIRQFRVLFDHKGFVGYRILCGQSKNEVLEKFQASFPLCKIIQIREIIDGGN